MGRRLDVALAVLNGAVGDHLARTGNGLAFAMAPYVHGEPVALRRDALERACPVATPRIVVLVHGLMNTEDIFRMPSGEDYGTLLRSKLGYTPWYVRYNSGLPIADNGASLSSLLDALLSEHPVPVTELLLLGYSMGGLVVRAATHDAAGRDAPWLRKVRRAVYVGTPHRGAPLERAGRVLTRAMRAIPDPYVQLAADLAALRSEGLQDLGDADLRHEDRTRRTPRLGLRDARHPVPLLPALEHCLVAGTLSPDPWLAALFGDAVVPLRSASGAGLEVSRLRVFPGLGHAALPRSMEVWEQLRAWCATP